MERPRNWRIHTLLAALFCVALLAAPAAADASWFLPERQLTKTVADQRWPDVSGSRVVYEDYRNAHEVGDPNDPDTLFDIRVLDTSGGASRLLTPFHTASGRPAISGDNVVWEDYGHGSAKGGIYHYNLKTGVRRRLPISSGRELRISGDRLVYESFRSGSWRIYVFNLATGRETRVTATGASPSAPDISGKWIVWQDHRDGNFEVYAKYLKTGVTMRITNDPASQQLPRIDGTKIVWTDDRNGLLNDDVYTYDLATGLERRVTTDPSRQFMPTISGNRVVWMDERTGDTEVYLYDLSSGAEVRVTNSAAYQGNPTISGTRIVYEDQFRPGTTGMDLYLSRIAAPKIDVDSSDVVAYGARAVVGGVVIDAADFAVAGKTVTLQQSSDNKTWISVDTTTTRTNGVYFMNTTPLVKRVYLRVRLAGDADYLGATSAALSVKPRLQFSDAPASSRYTFKASNAYVVWGYFLPKRGVSTVVQVRAYRYQRKADGSWGYVYRTSFPTIVTNPEGSTRTKYTALVRLPQRGKWRLRAYHPSNPLNAKTFSAVRGITVE